MKHQRKVLSGVLLLTCLMIPALTGCGSAPKTDEVRPSAEAGETLPQPEDPVREDYACRVKLDFSSETLKQEVTVRTYVDGDTTHFHVPTSLNPQGVMKVRYQAINTPESTGKIQEYGKAASRFTKERLMEAESIVLESETDAWNLDATGTRYLCWVWYKPAKEADYRNLNIELLQNGLARGNATANNRYGSMASAALSQAMHEKLGIFSGQPDPDFFYGDALELSLKELRLHLRDYEGKKVAFTAVVAQRGDSCVYAESYDPELDLYFGISIYYGFNLSGEGMEILTPGNEVRIVGTLQYYAPSDSWQISGVKYRAMKPEDPDNLQMLSEGHAAAFPLIDADTLVNGKVQLETEAGKEERDFGELSMSSTVSMENLLVSRVSSADHENNHAAMTLFCRSGDTEIPVRTADLRDEDGNLITEETFLGKTIDVKGVISSFDGRYQIQVYSLKNIKIH